MREAITPIFTLIAIIFVIIGSLYIGLCIHQDLQFSKRKKDKIKARQINKEE